MIISDPWLAVGLALALAGCGLALARAARRRLRALAARTEALALEADALRRELRALCSAQRNVGDRVVALEHASRQVLERQNQLFVKAPTGGSYRQAIALSSRGASPDELVSSCGLSRSEAELLCRIHAERPPVASAESLQ